MISVNYLSRLQMMASYVGMTDEQCQQAMLDFILRSTPKTKKTSVRRQVSRWWEGTHKPTPKETCVIDFFRETCENQEKLFDKIWFELPLNPDLRDIECLRPAINKTFGYYSALDNYRSYFKRNGKNNDELKQYIGHYLIWRVHSHECLVNDVFHIYSHENGSLLCRLYQYTSYSSTHENTESTTIKELFGNCFFYKDNIYAILSTRQSDQVYQPEPVFLIYKNNIDGHRVIGIQNGITDNGKDPLAGVFMIERLDKSSKKISTNLNHIKTLDPNEGQTKKILKVLECSNKTPSFIKINQECQNKFMT